jgi:hypothetical protein
VKETIRVDVKNEMYALIEGVTFAQVPYWFPFSYKDLKMDVLMPFMKPADGRGNPCIVWICGGELPYHGARCTRTISDILCKTWVYRGEYRVPPFQQRRVSGAAGGCEIRDPVLRENAQKFRIDPERVAVMGESAGGYLAAMAGATGIPVSLIQETISISPAR